MATGTKTPNTSEEQDAAYSPGDAHYEDEFNRRAKAEELSDLENNWDTPFQGKNGQHVDSHGDTVNNNYNADENIDKARNKEKEGDSHTGFYNQSASSSKEKFGGSLKGSRFKKLGPSGGLIGLIIGMVGIGSVATVPATLLIMLERTFTNNGTHDSRVNSTMSEGRLGVIFGMGGNRDCTTSKIKCKVSSMSKKEIDRWNSEKGVKVIEGKSTVFKRTIITGLEITTPEGEKITIKNANEFKKAIKVNPYVKSMYYRIHSPKATFFIGPESKFRSVLKKYKISLGRVFSKLKPGMSEEEKKKQLNADIDKQTGAEPDKTSAERVKGKIKSLKDKVSGLNDKFKARLSSKVAGIVGAAGAAGAIGCTLYTMHKATLTTIKLSYYIDLIRFFAPFMRVADQIINEGTADPKDAISPEDVAYIGDRLTWYQQESTAKTDDEKKKVGLTATDSQGFKAAMYGDFAALKDFTKDYVPWAALQAANVSGMLKTFEDAVGKGNIHKFCLGAKYLSYASYGTPWGAIIGGGCAIADLIGGICAKTIGKAMSTALQWVVDQGLTRVYEQMEKFILDSNLKGVSLGDAIGAGIGLFLMEKDRGSGLKPARSTKQVTAFEQATNSSYSNYIAAMQEDAQANPFDTSNQYSFASNMLVAMSQYKAKDTTAFSIVANMASVMGNAFKPTTSNAGYFQPIESLSNQKSLQSMTAEGNPNGQGRKCEDQDMVDIGVLCDWTGRSIDVTGTAPMEWANEMSNGDEAPWDATVDYMTKGKYIDDTGKPVDYDDYKEPTSAEESEEKTYDNQYLMYKAYCTNDRVYPLGTTMKAVDDDDAGEDNIGWLTGAKCAGNNADGTHISADFDTMLDRFFFYYNMCETQLGIADENQKCWEDEKTTTSSAEKNTGDWVAPVDGTCGEGFGVNRGSYTHAGQDIPMPQGTPIKAPTSMKITFVGQSPDGSTGNQVTATATDGSGISFRFMHMMEQSPLKAGQEVSKGQEIGKVGSTGNSTGAHLHLDVFPKGNDGMSYSGQIDPVAEFKKHNTQLCK